MVSSQGTTEVVVGASRATEGTKLGVDWGVPCISMAMAVVRFSSLITTT